ncbi:L-ascorbate oxidase [Strongylocentrotus purpuratus]|uniref:Laccase n=1 Tax=Strongylocentrotus purpuratus TaxID=7668 RepID=A0A7M7RCX8_STRPU|nr:L-ascorbate oxidase [Strongylocentrotus purpuratus]
MGKLLCLMLSMLIISTVVQGYGINDLDNPCLRECTGSEPMTCEYDWTIESYYSMSRACYQCPFNEFDCHRPHCIPSAGYARPVYSVNRQEPGPSIQVCENDIIKVHVHNRLQNEEGESIHWHGFHMQGTQHMDGVSGVTQCPINAGHDFTYEFIAEQPGTHWWHSHAGVHRADGVYGSLIVRQSSESDPHRALYDKDDPYHVITIKEWSKSPAIAISTAGQSGVAIDANDGILINGVGTNQVLSNSDYPNATIDHHVVYVTSGQRYRFRVISAANDVCALSISVDNHTLTVIAMDGAPVNPIDVDMITLFSAERYDFILNADQSPTNYWIRVAGLYTCAQYQEVAILQYAGAPPDSKPESDKDLRAQGKVLNPQTALRDSETVLVSDLTDADEKEDDLSHADVTHYLELNAVSRNEAKSVHHPVFYPYELAGTDTYSLKNLPIINNITMSLPGIPLLSHWRDVDEASWCNEDSLQTSLKDCSQEACECTYRIDIKYNQVVEVVYVNTARGIPHPMHIHGYYFEVLGMETMWDFFTIEDFKRLDAQGEISRNLKNPPRKDTIMIPVGGYVITRFRSDNPGWWLMHCHFDAHFALGMALVFHVEGSVPPPPASMPVCT